MKKMQVTRTTLEASTRALILARTVHPGHTIPCAHGQDRPAQAAAVHFIIKFSSQATAIPKHVIDFPSLFLHRHVKNYNWMSFFFF